MSLLRPGSVYKRLETDKEFIDRLRLKYTWYKSDYAGAELDDEAWFAFKMQRRIIERGP